MPSVLALVAAVLPCAAGPARLEPFASEAALSRYLASFDNRRRDASGKPQDPIFFSGPGWDMRDVSFRNDQAKLDGDRLLILRRGHLFSVSLSGMRLLDSIDVVPKGGDPKHIDLFRLVTAGDDALLMGQTYAGTLIERIHIGRDGRLAFRDAYEIDTFEGPTTLNYAPRVVAGRFVFFSERVLDGGDPLRERPAIRSWNPDGAEQPFETIGAARDFYVPQGSDTKRFIALHALISCDIDTPVLDCRASGAFGAPGRAFLMSSSAVYVWSAPDFGCWDVTDAPCTVYRLPLDGGAPGGVVMRGAPHDQSEVEEDKAGGVLNVLAQTGDDNRFVIKDKAARNSAALVRVPLSAFGPVLRDIDPRAYRILPSFELDGDVRFEGLLQPTRAVYSGGDFWEIPAATEPPHGHSPLFVAPVGHGAVKAFTFDYDVEKLVNLDGAVLMLGARGDTVLASLLESNGTLKSPFALPGIAPYVIRGNDIYVGPDHVLGFVDPGPSGDVSKGASGKPPAIRFVRYGASGFEALGKLEAHGTGAALADGCVSSCGDWYDDARTFFAGGRVYALMGYELVEGKVEGGAIRETRRTDFTAGER